MIEASKPVFLSYASEDSEIASRICKALREAGVEVWFDRSELRGGDAWDVAIRTHIKACAIFIPVISRTTVTRVEGYFRLEWKLAVDRSYLMAHNRPFLFPVVIDDTDQADERVPERFKELQWTRMPDGLVPAGFTARLKDVLTTDAQARPSITQPRGPKVNTTRGARSRATALMAALTILAFGWLAFQSLELLRRTAVTPAGSAAAPLASPKIPENSVAVLAFADMSQSKDQEYFSDGLAEELINQLSRIAVLRVPARTSSFYFKGRSDDIATIAAKLRVTYVLEGSVRKIDDRLRITTNLIRADDGYQVWNETFNLMFKDVFAVQDEIAAAVVNALKLKLAPGQLTPSQITSNTEAYSEYLLARQFYNAGNAVGYKHAIEASRKAIALDPKFGVAYADLATALFALADMNGDVTSYQQALEAANTAVTLAPESASGYSARGFIRSNHTLEWEEADSDYKKALAFAPNDAEVHNNYGQLLQSLGRLPEAIASARKATDLNPLSGPAWENLTRFLTYHGDFEEAGIAVTHALEIGPESMFALSNLGMLQLLRHRPNEALETFRKVNFEGFRLQGVALAEFSLGNVEGSQAALNILVNKYAQDGPFQIAEIYAWRGETDKAFEWLEHAFQAHDGGLANLKSDPLLASLRTDKRYARLIVKLRLP